jgi:hypothetical protein
VCARVQDAVKKLWERFHSRVETAMDEKAWSELHFKKEDSKDVRQKAVEARQNSLLKEVFDHVAFNTSGVAASIVWDKDWQVPDNIDGMWTRASVMSIDGTRLLLAARALAHHCCVCVRVCRRDEAAADVERMEKMDALNHAKANVKLPTKRKASPQKKRGGAAAAAGDEQVRDQIDLVAEEDDEAAASDVTSRGKRGRRDSGSSSGAGLLAAAFTSGVAQLAAVSGPSASALAPVMSAAEWFECCMLSGAQVAVVMGLLPAQVAVDKIPLRMLASFSADKLAAVGLSDIQVETWRSIAKQLVPH